MFRKSIQEIIELLQTVSDAFFTESSDRTNSANTKVPSNMYIVLYYLEGELAKLHFCLNEPQKEKVFQMNRLIRQILYPEHEIVAERTYDSCKKLVERLYQMLLVLAEELGLYGSVLQYIAGCLDCVR